MTLDKESLRSSLKLRDDLAEVIGGYLESVNNTLAGDVDASEFAEYLIRNNWVDLEGY